MAGDGKDDEVEGQLAEIQTMGTKGLARVAATALTSALPLGSALGSLLSEYASQRTTDRVCDVLRDIFRRLKEHDDDPTKHLSKDEVVETVHQTLAGAVITSDAEKLDYFKNGLAYSFLEGGPYGEKQILLDTLKNATVFEIGVIREIYLSPDPYLSSQDGLPPSPRENYLREPWEVVAEQPRGNLHLGHMMAKRLGVERGIIDGVASILAGKGLATMVPQLDDNYSVVVRRKAAGGMLASVGGSTFPPSNPRLTPIARSRTAFGWRFVDFCNYEGARPSDA